MSTTTNFKPNKIIPLFRPYMPFEVREAGYRALHNPCLTQGPMVDEFEAKFKAKFGLSNAVSVNSGTSALELVYELIGLKPGDEVITTPLTCTATNLPLLRRGVKLVWADITDYSLCIDPLDVYRKITDRTKAVVQVHLGGVGATVHLGSLATDLGDGIPYPIPIISDSAQALGIFGGDYTCCSFQAIKHITTVDGGMLVCPSLHQARNAKLLRWYGIDREKRADSYKTREMTFDIELPGTKKHMNDFTASLGLAGLFLYDIIIEHRKKLFKLYKSQLSNCPGILGIMDGVENVYGLFTLLVESRDDFSTMLAKAGVESNLVHLRNDIYRVFGGKRQDLPVMNRVEDQYISLPIGMHISEEDVYYICSTIKGGW